ncbi:MAG: hypothetical protein GX606_05560, partial [Elusimicrobia bacterium]|nr:hypothetical protein [Elusimicrobiota bacterium]
AFRVTVRDAGGREDVTRTFDLPVRFLEEKPEDLSAEDEEKALEERRRIWLASLSRENTLERQSISVEGETLRVTPQLPLNALRLLRGGQTLVDVPVLAEQKEITADDVRQGETDSGSEVLDLILPRGDYAVVPDVSSEGLSAQGAVTSAPQISSLPEGAVLAATEHVKVGDDYLFFVGLTDITAGYAMNSGHIEPLERGDAFRDGFYVENKTAFHVKGKIRGKYLIEASYDSERDKEKLFEGLDPDDYYPVYGDSSSVDAGSDNTQGPLYLLIEWDRSSLRWGNYSVAMTETEFAQFTRTLYGAAGSYESMATTLYGEPRSKVFVFSSTTKQRAGHNEFLATGGSLYYLKNKDVIEGSEALKVEVRDNITGLVVSSRTLEPSIDYEIDKDQGRILLTQPLAALADTSTLISNSVLNGNPVYLIVDYQYKGIDKYDQSTRGLRVSQAVNDYLRVGTTYVEETLLDTDYVLKGTDVTLRPDKDTTIVAEYAETSSESVGSYLSTDGGLNFTQIQTGDATTDRAYGIKGDTKILDRVGLKAYYKWIGHDFSTASTVSQQSKELAGFETTMDVTSATRLTARYDIQRLIQSGTDQVRMQVGAQETRSTLLQVVHDLKRLKVSAELKRNEVIQKDAAFT